MNFPENCIRGIPNKSFFHEDGNVSSSLFHFKDEDTREDGFIEQSINWQDDDESFEILKNQKKPDGTIQFKSGCVILSKEKIDNLKTSYQIKGSLSYERAPLIQNPYHGNLLLNSNISNKQTKKQIAAGLALCIINQIENTNIDV